MMTLDVIVEKPRSRQIVDTAIDYGKSLLDWKLGLMCAGISMSMVYVANHDLPLKESAIGALHRGTFSFFVAGPYMTHFVRNGLRKAEHIGELAFHAVVTSPATWCFFERLYLDHHKVANADRVVAYDYGLTAAVCSGMAIMEYRRRKHELTI